MNGFLLDTNVLSELRKGARGNAGVRRWFEAAPDAPLYLSVLVTGEIRQGIERARDRDPQKVAALENWLHRLEADHVEHLLPVTREVADRWGRLNAVRPLPVVDGLLAATAQVHGLMLVTRNVADLRNTGTDLLNPFD